jgi:hypothetical protein
VLSGYFDAAGYCWKIAEHGTLLPGGITPETVLNIDVDSIYFYFNENGVDCGTYMPLVVRKKRGNNFTIDDATIVNILMTEGKVDSTYYPQ